jgi:hypothetical protein
MHCHPYNPRNFLTVTACDFVATRYRKQSAASFVPSMFHPFFSINRFVAGVLIWDVSQN